MATSEELRQWWEDYLCDPDENWSWIDFLHTKVYVPNITIDAYRALEQALKVTDYEADGSDTGTYNCRPINHDPDNPLSLHSAGIAIDVDWFENPLGPSWSNAFSGRIQREHVEAIEGIRNTDGEQLWTWGGWWSIRDRMHFQLDVPPSRVVVDWDTVPRKEQAMALTPEEETFVKEMYAAAQKNQEGGPNGFLIAPTLELIYQERQDPALRESDRDTLTSSGRRHKHKFTIRGETKDARG